MRRVNLLHAHGSPTRYWYTKGCRCVACRAAKAKCHREEAVEAARKYRAEHREEGAECSRKYRAGHREEVAEYRRKYRAEHAEERAEYNRKYRAEHRGREYGLDTDAWNELFAGQSHCCECCGTNDPGHKHGWRTDHDHKTGKVRGILCHHCNTGLGGFRDDPARLMAAIKYLAAVTP